MVLPRFFFTAAFFFLCLSCFSLPLSSAVMNIASAAMVLFWLLSGECKRLPAIIRKNKVLWPSVLLFLLLFIGVFYSSASWNESLMAFKKYRELLYLPLVFSLLQSAKRQKLSRGFSVVSVRYSLLAGMATLMLISYGMYFAIIPMKYGDYDIIQQLPQQFFVYSNMIVNYSTIHHITHSFFMAILSFWALQEAFIAQNKGRKFYKPLFLILFFLATVNVFFISSGRSGMAVYTLLIIIFAIQRLKLWQSILSFLLVCGLLVAIYYSSTNVAIRVDAAMRDIQHYHQGTSRSSLGMRFDWWGNSLTLIKERPLTGYGTGAFSVEQQRITMGRETQPSDNPHNEYLMLGVQLGIPGIALFTLLLAALVATSFSLPKKERELLQGITLAFAWGCLANSWLFDSHPSHFFLIAVAVLINKKEHQESLV